MVEVIKDERIVLKEGNAVIFKHENMQKYTEDQARGVYAQMVDDYNNKSKILEKYSDIEKQAIAKYEQEINEQIEILKRNYPEFTPIELRGWKRINIALNTEELKAKLKTLKEDLENIKEGIAIWESTCKDLPESTYEKKKKELEAKKQLAAKNA